MTSPKTIALTLLLICAPAAAQTRVQTPVLTNPIAGTPGRGATPVRPAPPVEPCGCEQPVPETLAVVNGTKITVADIEAPDSPLARRVAELQAGVVEARQRELDLQINSRLLEAEAKRRGVAATKLLDDEIVAAVKEPTEAEARAFYDENKARIRVEFAEVKDNVTAHLRELRQREAAGKFAERLRAAARVEMLVKRVTPPATPADRARLLATVNGERLTSADVEGRLRPLIFAVQEQVYALRREALDRAVNVLLLEQEAQRQKLTARALLAAEVDAKTAPVTDAAAQAFYDENKARIEGDFPRVKEQLVTYLREQEKNKSRGAFAERLRRGATVQTFIVAPEPPVLDIATDDQPTKGDTAAPVTIVEFTDFQCSNCAQSHLALERLLAEYGGRVRLVVRDFPLRQHADAFKAAEAAEAAREQGKYWEYVSLLYANQNALGVTQLKEYASRINLDRARFDSALDSNRFSPQVRRDIQDGTRLGVGGTPTIFINGRRADKRSYEALKSSIDALLRTPAQR